MFSQLTCKSVISFGVVMDSSSGGKAANSSFSIRYHANNEELEEVFRSEDDAPTPRTDAYAHSDSPRRDKSGSIIDKYFKSMRGDKHDEKRDVTEDKSTPRHAHSGSPSFLIRSKRKDAEDGKDGPNETWRIFQDFKVKIAQAVEDIKSSRAHDEKEKSVARDSSVSDSDDNSAARDADQLSVGDTDNQVSSLHSSIQNLSELTQAATAKVTDASLPDKTKTLSESSDDTQKNLKLDDAIDDSLDVESGVEALEHLTEPGPKRSWTPKHSEHSDDEPPLDYLRDPLIPAYEDTTRVVKIPKKYFFTFANTMFTLAVIFSCTLVPSMLTWNGILMGMWTLNFLLTAREFLSDRLFEGSEVENYVYFNRKRTEEKKVAFTITPIKEHVPVKKFEGWINHYKYADYDPNTYHINNTTTAFMKLEDSTLRLSYTKTKVSKRALWDEKVPRVAFYEHALYNLAGARVILLPSGLIGKRFWSKKYPIVVILNESEKMQVLEKETKEESPEKTKKEEGANEAQPTEGGGRRIKLVLRAKDRDAFLRPGLRHRKKRDVKDDSTRDPELLDEADKSIAVKNVIDRSMADNSVADDTAEDGEANSEGLRQPDLDEENLREIYDIIDEAEAQEGEDPAEWRVDSRQPRNTHLYIFPRTGRDKFEWYRRISAAIRAAEDAETECSRHDSEENVYKLADNAVGFSKLQSNSYLMAPEPVTVSLAEETLGAMNMRAHETNFWPYMYKIIQQQCRASESAASSSSPSDVAWLNAAIARFAYDAVRNPQIVARVQRRVQRKLSSLKLPSVVDSLTATELCLGSASPVVELVAGPACDERGVWLDAEVRYEGDAYITLHTNINLMKLNEKKMETFEEQMERLSKPLNEVELDRPSPVEGTTPPCLQGSPGTRRPKPPSPATNRTKCAIYDSEVDDSAESSSDDDSATMAEPEDSPEAAAARASDASSSAKKFLRIVDKITTSRYFQHVSDYKFVKRAMEGISNTDIKLHLDIKGLEGRLAINLPPPPHDRVWIGFRANPRLWLKARPVLGTRAVRIAHITNWIERRLCKEFEKVLVLPNMEDMAIDLLTPTPVETE